MSETTVYYINHVCQYMFETKVDSTNHEHQNMLEMISNYIHRVLPIFFPNYITSKNRVKHLEQKRNKLQHAWGQPFIGRQKKGRAPVQVQWTDATSRIGCSLQWHKNTCQDFRKSMNCHVAKKTNGKTFENGYRLIVTLTTAALLTVRTSKVGLPTTKTPTPTLTPATVCTTRQL